MGSSANVPHVTMDSRLRGNDIQFAGNDNGAYNKRAAYGDGFPLYTFAVTTLLTESTKVCARRRWCHRL